MPVQMALAVPGRCCAMLGATVLDQQVVGEKQRRGPPLGFVERRRGRRRSPSGRVLPGMAVAAHASMIPALFSENYLHRSHAKESRLPALCSWLDSRPRPVVGPGAMIATLLAGYLLLRPPVRHTWWALSTSGKYYADVDAELDKWEQEKANPTPGYCEKERQQVLTKLNEVTDNGRSEAAITIHGQDLSPGESAAWIESWRASRCLPDTVIRAR